MIEPVGLNQKMLEVRALADGKGFSVGSRADMGNARAHYIRSI